jgi:hypothetical protein
MATDFKFEQKKLEDEIAKLSSWQIRVILGTDKISPQIISNIVKAQNEIELKKSIV